MILDFWEPMPQLLLSLSFSSDSLSNKEWKDITGERKSEIILNFGLDI